MSFSFWQFSSSQSISLEIDLARNFVQHTTIKFASCKQLVGSAAIVVEMKLLFPISPGTLHYLIALWRLATGSDFPSSLRLTSWPLFCIPFGIHSLFLFLWFYYYICWSSDTCAMDFFAQPSMLAVAGGKYHCNLVGGRWGLSLYDYYYAEMMQTKLDVYGYWKNCHHV